MATANNVISQTLRSRLIRQPFPPISPSRRRSRSPWEATMQYSLCTKQCEAPKEEIFMVNALHGTMEVESKAPGVGVPPLTAQRGGESPAGKGPILHSTPGQGCHRSPPLLERHVPPASYSRTHQRSAGKQDLPTAAASQRELDKRTSNRKVIFLFSSGSLLISSGSLLL